MQETGSRQRRIHLVEARGLVVLVVFLEVVIMSQPSSRSDNSLICCRPSSGIAANIRTLPILRHGGEAGRSSH